LRNGFNRVAIEVFESGHNIWVRIGQAGILGIMMD
jgi:hypothetical protein